MMAEGASAVAMTQIIKETLMTRRNNVALFLILAFAAAASACNVSYSSARISDAKMAKSVNDKKEAVDPTSSFDPDVPVIHCVVNLANAPDDTKLKARWSVVKAEGQEPNSKIADTDIVAGGNNNIVDFTLKPSGELPVGEYKVDIYLNPKPENEGQPAKTLTFSVKQP
jgi:hypothetical protein